MALIPLNIALLLKAGTATTFPQKLGNLQLRTMPSITDTSSLDSQGSMRETPYKGTLLALLKRDLIERVYSPKAPPNPNSYP